jgi:hypothetical protein
MADLPPGPGWYRLGDHGWEHVPDDVALAEYAAMVPGYEELVWYSATAPAMVEEPLF